jgi:hypothetical protein
MFDEQADPIHPEADDFWVDVGEAEEEPPKYIIPGLLPVGAYFIGGPPKSMKTTILLGMANLVAGRQCGLLPSFMAGVERPGRAMLLEAEATAGELKSMSLDMGVKPVADGMLLAARDHGDFRLDDSGAVQRLLAWLDKFQPRLFAVDPMVEFHSLEEKDAGAMQRFLRPFRRWAVQTDSCFLLVHHTTKPGEAHSGTFTPTDLRGSGALFGAANGVLMVSPTKVSGQLVMSATFKRGAPWQRTIQLGIFGKRAEEVLGLRDKAIWEALRAAPVDPRGRRTTNPGALALSVRLPDGTPMPETLVKESLDKLHRNGKAILPYGLAAPLWEAT